MFQQTSLHMKLFSVFFLVWSLFYTFLVIVFLSSRLIFSMLRARFALIFSMVFLSQKSRNVFKYSQPLYFLQTESNPSLVVVSIWTDRHRSFNSIWINLKWWETWPFEWFPNYSVLEALKPVELQVHVCLWHEFHNTEREYARSRILANLFPPPITGTRGGRQVLR